MLNYFKVSVIILNPFSVFIILNPCILHSPNPLSEMNKILITRIQQLVRSVLGVCVCM